MTDTRARAFLNVERSASGRRWQARLEDARVAEAIAQRHELPEILGRVLAARGVGIDEAEAVAVLLEKHEIVRDLFHGFDYRPGLAGTPQERLVTLAGAIEWVLDRQQRDAARETTPEGKTRAHRRFADAVLALLRRECAASGAALLVATHDPDRASRAGYPVLNCTTHAPGADGIARSVFARPALAQAA